MIAAGYIPQTVKKCVPPYCVCRGDHWSPANLPQQRIFRDSFLQGKRARASNARPYKSFSTVWGEHCPPVLICHARGFSDAEVK